MHFWHNVGLPNRFCCRQTQPRGAARAGGNSIPGWDVWLQQCQPGTRVTSAGDIPGGNSNPDFPPLLTKILNFHNFITL